MDLDDIADVKYQKVEFNKKSSDDMLELANKHPDVELISIKYMSDGLSIHGWIFKHKNLSKETPVLIFCRCRPGRNYKKLFRPR